MNFHLVVSVRVAGLFPQTLRPDDANDPVSLIAALPISQAPAQGCISRRNRPDSGATRFYKIGWPPADRLTGTAHFPGCKTPAPGASNPLNQANA